MHGQCMFCALLVYVLCSNSADFVHWSYIFISHIYGLLEMEARAMRAQEQA